MAELDNKHRVRFVVNPRSGPDRGGDVQQAIRELRLPEGHSREISPTERPGHAGELAAEASERGYGLVVAVGGDGTIHEVLQGLVGTETALGIVPRGSGNALAREFGIPLDLERALQVVAQGAPRRVDAAEVNGRRFLSTFGTGLDARVVLRYEREAGKVRGLLPYAATGLREFLSYRPQPVRLHLNGESLDLRPLVLVVANARLYGGGAIVAANARMDDGLLDVVYVPPVGLRRAAYYTLKMFAGTLHRGSRVETRRGSEMELELAADTPVQLDGEPMLMGGRLSIRCLPQSLLVWAPA